MQAPEMTAVDFVSRLGIGAVLGVAIGFERQWRQRSAGLQTSSLVATGAALFALLDSVIGAGDHTRILAGVVSGVGFIAAGVIIRDGNSVSGLNTAATIWATAAVGALAGLAFFEEAVLGAVAIILLNVLLQPIVERVDARARRHQDRETVYKLSVVYDADQKPPVGETIVAAVSDSALSLQSLTRSNANGASVRLHADILSAKRQDHAVELLSTRLASMPGVVSSNWQAVNS
jgi:putative Mg2+ transporter-C (MgtC) family protein